MNTNEDIKNKIQDCLEEFNHYAQKLNLLWERADYETQNSLAEDYPFDSSFDEVVDKIFGWMQTQREINKP